MPLTSSTLTGLEVPIPISPVDFSTNKSSPLIERFPVAEKFVEAPSNAIEVSATAKSPLTSSVVPESAVSVPDVKLSLVSDLRNCKESKLSSVSASSPPPEPSAIELRTPLVTITTPSWVSPLKVIVPLEVTPVAAVIAPVELTWNWLVDPTDSREDGAVVPIPTFPPSSSTSWLVTPSTFITRSPVEATCKSA